MMFLPIHDLVSSYVSDHQTELLAYVTLVLSMFVLYCSIQGYVEYMEVRNMLGKIGRLVDTWKQAC